MLRCRSALLTMPWSYHRLGGEVLICTLFLLLSTSPNNMGQKFSKELRRCSIAFLRGSCMQSKHGNLWELNNTHIPCVSQPARSGKSEKCKVWWWVESSITLSTFKISKGLFWFHIHRLTLQTLRTLEVAGILYSFLLTFNLWLRTPLPAAYFPNSQTSISLPCDITLCSSIHKTHYFLHICNLNLQYSLRHLAVDYANLD